MSRFLDDLRARAAARAQRGHDRELRAWPASGADGLLDLAGNDYLGLSRHPDVVAGAVAAVRSYGAGARASRLVSGS